MRKIYNSTNEKTVIPTKYINAFLLDQEEELERRFYYFQTTKDRQYYFDVNNILYSTDVLEEDDEFDIYDFLLAEAKYYSEYESYAYYVFKEEHKSIFKPFNIFYQLFI